jgi:hypothetical protein
MEKLDFTKSCVFINGEAISVHSIEVEPLNGAQQFVRAKIEVDVDILEVNPEIVEWLKHELVKGYAHTNCPKCGVALEEVPPIEATSANGTKLGAYCGSCGEKLLLKEEDNAPKNN